MKKQKILSSTIILVLVSSMLFGITSVIAEQNLMVPLSSIGYNESPALVQKFADVTHFDHQVASADPVTTPFWADLVNTERVRSDGTGVYVAVLDTGLLPGWESLFSNANIAADLGIGFSHDITSYDVDTGSLDIGPLKVVPFETELASGHGTHVTSTITGFNLNGEWIDGIAPGVTIIPVRVLDAWIIPGTDGNYYGFSGGLNDMIAMGIYYIADLAESLDAPVVINMSLGGGYSQLIEDAIDYAISQDVIVVAAAGNEGEAGMGYPGALPQSISVGALGWTDMFNQNNTWRADVPELLFMDDSMGNDFQVYLEDFSSRPNPALGQDDSLLDLSAPGAWIVGPYKSAFSTSVGYYYLSGTSMASPHVAAISALVLQLFPELSQSEMESILVMAASGTLFNALRGFPSSGTDVKVAFPFVPEGYYTLSWDENDFGAGFLTADAAVFSAFMFYMMHHHHHHHHHH